MNYNTDHPLYPRWNAMLSRCLSPGDPNYRRFGGRGIHVCKEWEDFGNYVAWWEQQLCGMPIQKDYQIRRIDPRGDFSPENCKLSFDPRSISGGNAEKIKIEYKGYDLTVDQWSAVTGLDRGTIYSRWRRTRDPRYTLTTPVHSKGGTITPKKIPEIVWATRP